MKIELYSRCTILAKNSNYTVKYHKGKVLVEKNNDKTVIIEHDLYSFPLSLLSHMRFIDRLLRLEPRGCIQEDRDSFLLSYKGKLIQLNSKNRSVTLETIYPVGTNNPLYFSRYKRDGQSIIIYGEYSWNPNRKEVGVFCKADKKWNKLFEFPSDSILHVHNIIYDNTRDCLWILTGDEDNESGIWKYLIVEKKLEKFLVGKQKYRACYAYVENDSLYYATDTPLEPNAVYRVDLKSKQIKLEYLLPGPCIYGREYNNEGKKYHCFATSVEPDSSLQGLRYKLTYKLGKGIIDRYCHIITRYPDGEYKEIFRGKKDILPMWLFQFGNVRFAECEMLERRIIINPTAIKKMDGKSYYLEL